MERPESTLGLLRWVGFAQRKAADDWARERGLSMEQGFTLGYLIDSPGAIQRDIARMSRTSAASVSSLLQGLERRGLVERRTEAGDDRSKRVYATPEGADLIAGFETSMKDADERLLAPLDPAEQAQLHALLQKLVADLPVPTRG